MAAGGEFVEGWLVAQVLGEGAYGEVRLLRHRGSGAAVALKVVGGGAGGAREAALHGALRHAHVLRCLGARAHQQHHYLFLEWARGGELFARIAPDVGLPASAARRHWRQLLAGLRYLHARGVAHRDIKPENLLLDHNDDIKISDFGMATLFRHGTRERLLSRVCGTVPYAAPEVLRAAAAPYRAPPADVWPAALVLLAMLAGELPWERASDEDARYVEWSQWVTSQQASSPPPRGAWRKLSAPALALLRAALHPDASRRASLDALLQHEWLAEHDAPRAEAEGRWCRSQPAAAPSALSAADMEALIRHSQPAAADEPRDEGGERRAAWSVALRVRADEALRALGAELRRRGHCARRLHPRLLAATCADGLKLRVWALPVQAAGAEGTLLEFRRWRGCGLHFKRRFVELRDALRHLEAPRDTDTDTMSQ